MRGETLNTKAENLNPVQSPEVGETAEAAKADAPPSKRAFVEPDVTFPVDVLEATTFFQFTESGVTNP
jgi:hypothetical protein